MIILNMIDGIFLEVPLTYFMNISSIMNVGLLNHFINILFPTILGRLYIFSYDQIKININII